MTKKREKGTQKLFFLLLLIVAIGYGAYYFYSALSDNNSVKIYFFSKDGHLVPVQRHVDEKQDKLEVSSRELVKGPNDNERASGMFSQIPKNANVISTTMTQGTIAVNFSRQLGMYDGGASNVRYLLSQIVYTFTELRGIKKVQILINGEEAPTLGSEGLIIDKPLSREDVSSKI